MSVLRFPNSQSDLNRLVSQMALVAKHYPTTTQTFSLDEMRDVLAGENQISSSGASGVLAVQKSTRADRSRDPLYNQVKMMSELYRMFGWFRSHSDSRLLFRLTNLGLTLSLDSVNYGPDVRSGLLRESLLRVVFPNTTTTNVGVTHQRPFRWLLQLVSELGGYITRDEIIAGVLAITDDLIPGAMQKTTDLILDARKSGNSSRLVEDISRANGVQVNTLQNYTRLPIGVLSSETVGWAKKASRPVGPRNEKRLVFELSDLGFETVKGFRARFDLRAHQIADLTPEKRDLIANFAFYEMLSLAGIPESDLDFDLTGGASQVDHWLSPLGKQSDQSLLYNPELQETDLVLNRIME